MASSRRAWSDSVWIALSVTMPGLERRHETGEILPGGSDHRLELIFVEFPRQCAERLDDRAVRHTAVADVGAAAEEHPHVAVRRQRRCLANEA